MSDWATDTNYASGTYAGQPTKIAPPSGNVQSGFIPGAPLPIEYLNWLLNKQNEEVENRGPVFRSGPVDFTSGLASISFNITTLWPKRPEDGRLIIDAAMFWSNGYTGTPPNFTPVGGFWRANLECHIDGGVLVNAVVDTVYASRNVVAHANDYAKITSAQLVLNLDGDVSPAGIAHARIHIIDWSTT